MIVSPPKSSASFQEFPQSLRECTNKMLTLSYGLLKQLNKLVFCVYLASYYLMLQLAAIKHYFML